MVYTAKLFETSPEETLRIQYEVSKRPAGKGPGTPEAPSGRVRPEKLITHRYHGMEQIPEAMDLFLHHDRSLIKPVIYND